MKHRILQWTFTIIVLMIAASCSKKEGDRQIDALLDRIPQNAEIVAAGNLRTIIESAGGAMNESGITLPPYILEQLPASSIDDISEMNEFLAGSGINTDAVALTGSLSHLQAALIFGIADMDKFTSTLSRENFTEIDNESSIKYYSNKDSKLTVALDGTFGYIFISTKNSNTDKAVRSLGRLISDAASAPFSRTTFSEYISESNALGISIRIPTEIQHELRRNGIPPALIRFYDGVFAIQCDINKNAITSRMKWFNTDGSERKFSDLYGSMDFSARISADAIAYFNSKESLIGAVSLKDMDWDSYIESISQAASLPRSERAMLSVIKTYLESIDGTVAFGLGLDNGLGSVANLSGGHDIMNQFSATIVIETKALEAGKLLDNIKSFMDLANMSYENSSNSITMAIPQAGGALYAEATENMLIISNRPISKHNDNATISAIPFTDYLAAGGIVLNRDNALMRDLNIDYDILISGTTSPSSFESVTKVEINGDDNDGVIAKIAKIAMMIARRSDKIESRIKGNSTDIPA